MYENSNAFLQSELTYRRNRLATATGRTGRPRFPRVRRQSQPSSTSR